MIHLLLAEDNAEYRKLLAIRLRRAGYAVHEAGDGEEALALLEKERADLIVADIMMPKMSGFQLISDLRGKGNRVPVLVITAREQFDAMRESFRRGADDYLTKPVRTEELLLRIEALLRRCGQVHEKELRLGGYVLNEETLCVEGTGVSVPLRRREFQLLAKLAQNPGKIFTRQELMDEVWGYESESDPRTVDTHIRRLREKLVELDSISIRTERGLGYRVVKV